MKIQSVTGLATSLWMGRFDKARPPEGSKLPNEQRRQALQDDDSDGTQEDYKRTTPTIAKQRHTRGLLVQERDCRWKTGQRYSKERMSPNSVKGLMTYLDPPTINGTTRGTIHRVPGLATNLWFGWLDKTRPPEEIEHPSIPCKG
jgi:hypothetical protein